jgi:uncharacterized membrane-anchored protein
MNGPAKGLMILGALIFLSGAAVYAASKLGLPFGRLPGDISRESGNFKIFVPITSMIVVSVLLTIILNIISRFGK